MRILVASNSYPTKKNPTRQVFVKNIAEGLKNSGHDVDIVYNLYFRFFKSDLETGNIPTKFLKGTFLLISYLPFLLYKGREYDILYSHAPVLPGFLLTFATKLHKVKHVTYVHGGVAYTKENKLLYKYSKKTMDQCDLVFTNSNYMKEYLSKHYQVDSVIVTPGYDRSFFYNYDHAERPIDLLFTGSCIRRKGIYTLLESIYTYSSYYRLNHLSVHICCSGVEKEYVIDFCKRHQLEDFITLREKLTQEQLVLAYNESKMVVLPSYDEALGLVGIEAIACGAFLIASDTGGIPEYLKHEDNGLLFEPGNSEQLNLAIRKAFDDKLWVRNQVNQNKMDQSLEKYTLSTGIEQTLFHFKNLLSEKDSTFPNHSHESTHSSS